MDWTPEEIAEAELWYGTGKLTEDEVVPVVEYPDVVLLSDEDY